jgi:hypothetical protein
MIEAASAPEKDRRVPPVHGLRPAHTRTAAAKKWGGRLGCHPAGQTSAATAAQLQPHRGPAQASQARLDAIVHIPPNYHLLAACTSPIIAAVVRAITGSGSRGGDSRCSKVCAGTWHALGRAARGLLSDMAGTMLALVFEGHREIRLTDSAPRPHPSAPGDAVVRVALCGICGSDLHPFRGDERGIERGTVVGHEASHEGGRAGGAVRRCGRVINAFASHSPPLSSGAFQGGC